MMRHDFGGRLWRAVGPGPVDRVFPDRDQRGAGLVGGCLQRGHVIRAHQARIVADCLAGELLLRQPAKGAGVRNALTLPQLRRSLVGRLQRVAPVRKNHCLVGEHEGRAERAGKARHPGQALVRVRQVLVLVFVVVRHIEAVEAHGDKLLAEQRKVRTPVLRAALDVEGLSHVRMLPLRPVRGKRI